jgi:uncharacterized protein YqeY
MSLEQTLTVDIAAAMKAKNAPRLSTLRMLKAALMNKSVEKNRSLEAAEELQVVASLVKQRRDSIEQFVAGGRKDLADKEAAEITILETYLPPSVPVEELEAIVTQAIAETGAASAKDIGKVMKAAMARVAGKTVDGRKLNEMVRAKLT